MARKSRIASASSSTKQSKRGRSPIPEAFRVVSSANVAEGATDVEVPILVLCGEWLKAIGFPIGSAAYLTSDAQGELVLHRMGLRMPRRLKVRATPVWWARRALGVCVDDHRASGGLKPTLWHKVVVDVLTAPSLPSR